MFDHPPAHTSHEKACEREAGGARSAAEDARVFMFKSVSGLACVYLSVFVCVVCVCVCVCVCACVCVCVCVCVLRTRLE